ncbi:YMGG-like glycine zipper-containing protein [Aureimonas ureilytica]|uniref:YMGG-like glycine zipper-containing protein n=1 Tax=Aureimonas ureilytica TaxID=401562 RepID=UPI00037681FB|nr:YMGG-like glycine zipper-containing protein [Aureimonas ureilytica]
MKPLVKSSIALGAIMMLAAGCTTTERTIGGAAIGGVGGAAVGNAIGGSGGAIIGGVAGGTAGALIGRESGRRANGPYYRY